MWKLGSFALSLCDNTSQEVREINYCKGQRVVKILPSSGRDDAEPKRTEMCMLMFGGGRYDLSCGFGENPQNWGEKCCFGNKFKSHSFKLGQGSGEGYKERERDQHK